MTAIAPYLPWISLIVVIIAIFARDGLPASSEKGAVNLPKGPFGALIVITLVAMFAGWKWNEAGGGLLPVVAGLAVGVAASGVAYVVGLLPGQVNAGRTGPIAVAALGASLAANYGDKGSFAFVFGASCAAWLLSLGSSEEPNPWAMRSAIYGAAIVACNVLIQKANLQQDQWNLGTFLALGGAVAGVVAGLVSSPLEKKNSAATAKWISSVLALLLWVGAAWLLERRAGLAGSSSLLFAASGVVALIVAWLVPDNTSSSTVRVIIAGVLWIAMATTAFGYERGVGMAYSLLAGAGMLLLAGNRRALLSLGPLAALVLYRVFRATHSDANQAFDIGQHYALIGLLLGVLLPVMAQEWIRSLAVRTGARTLTAGVLWIILLAAVPIPIAVGLSDKGIIGYLVGLGIASVLEAAKGERSAQSLSLGLGLGAAMTLLYDWLVPHVDLERHAKLIALSWIMGVAAVMVIAIIFLSADRAKTAEVEA
jgi:hypothetical protein